MKNLFFTILILLIGASAWSQQIGFTYQAVALDESKAEGFGRDSKGQVLLNQPLKVRFTIHEQSADGVIQYQEMHATTTDIFGIFRVVIGSGEKLLGTNLEMLRWSDQSYFMQVEIDLGNGFINMGEEVIVVPPFGFNNTIQLLNLTGTQLSISEGNNVDLSNLLGAARLSEQEVDAYVANNGYLLSEVDGSTTNEIQDLQLSGSQLTITNNPNSSVINLSPYLGNNLTEEDVDNMVANNGYLTEEIQDLNLNENTLTITNNNTATNIDLSPYRNVFETTGSVTSNANGNYGTDDFVFGGPMLDHPAEEANRNRLFFDKSKGALRAGYTNDASWNDTNRGFYSTAFGFNNIALGVSSFSVGENNSSLGASSVSLGVGNTATGSYSFSAGTSNAASGYSSFAGGFANLASGFNAFALGDHSSALGDYSKVFAHNSTAYSYGETVLGTLATEYAPVGDVTPTDRLFTIGNGMYDFNSTPPYSFTRSDALVILKNGNTRLHGRLTIDADNLIGTGEEYTLPGQDGNTNQVMTTDGNGNVTWSNTDASSSNEIQDLNLTGNTLSITNNTNATQIDLTPYQNIFERTNGVISNENGDYDTDDFVFGGQDLNSNGTKFFFDKSNFAFRIGLTNNNAWADANIGIGSFGFGINSLASGAGAISFGVGSSATFNGSIAMGNSNQSAGISSFAAGQQNTVNGHWSTAFGLTSTIDPAAFRAVSMGGGNTISGWGGVGIGNRLQSRSTSEITLGYGNTDVSPASNTLWIPTDRLFVIGNGTPLVFNDLALPPTRSDALVMLKNGNTRLHGQLTIDADNVSGAGGDYTLPGQRGTNGQALVTNGSGVVSWSTLPVPAFNTVAGVTSNSPGNPASDDFVFGSTHLANNGNSAHNNRMFFDKSKGAFRAGGAPFTDWDDANVGVYSVALGYRTRASGTSSFAAGDNSRASGSNSIGMGNGNNASGDYSSAIGRQNNVSGLNSHAHGFGNIITAAQSAAVGYSNNISSPVPNNSTGGYALGENHIISGLGGVAVGISNNALDIYTSSFGTGSYAFGQYSMTLGRAVTAFSYGETAMGTYSTNYVGYDVANYVGTNRLFVIGNGPNQSSRSDALVMLKNGNTRLHGQLTIDADNVAGVGGDYTFPGQRGTNGQALVTDGSGVVSWSTLPMPAFNTAAGVTSNSPGNYATDDFVFGSPVLANDGDATHQNRMFFDKSKGSFRTGRATGTQWDDANVGQYSMAIGTNSTASGNGSVAFNGGLASGTGSFSIGPGSAMGLRSFSHGGSASGDVSVAMGTMSLASGNGSIAIGANCISNDWSSVAMGNNATASGYASVSLGYYSSATADLSVALGSDNIASGISSTALGFANFARSYSETTLGLMATDYTPLSTTAFELTDRLFTIGNGEGGRSDALVMLKNGNTRLHGQLTIDADNVSGVGEAYTLPGQDGAADQVLTTDGNGAVSWQDAAESILGRTTTIISNENGNYTTDSFVIGSPGLDDDGNADHHTRMFFEKTTGAFRVGTVTDTRWDEAERGTNSVAMGLGNIARGNSSLSLGQNNLAHSASSVAIGTNNQAEGYNSIALGRNVATTGVHAMALSLYSASRSYGETTMGIYAVDYVPNSTTNFDGNDRLFTLGNGLDDANRSNALVIFKNGDATLLGTLTDASDMRLKRNIKALQNSLSSLNNLQGVHYQWNGRKPQDTLALQTGLIAQEVEKIFPELVKTDEEGFKSVNYIGLVPHLIEAIKELKKENEELKSEAIKTKASTEQRITYMETKLLRFEALLNKAKF